MTTARLRGNNRAGVSWAMPLAAATIMVATGAGVALLSRGIDPLGAATGAPLVPMVVLLIFGSIVYAAACSSLSGRESSPIAFALVLVVALAAGATQLASRPVGNTDYARYLIDGGAVACGENPYRLTPNERSRVLATVAALGAGNEPSCFLGDPRWRQLFAIVENGGEITPYPPLAVLWFGAVVRAFGPSLLALRVSFLIAELAVLVVLAFLLERLGLSLLLIAVVGWAPLVLKEVLNAAHYDIVPALLLTVSLLLMTMRRPAASMAVLGCIVATKLFAAILLPLWLRATEPGHRTAALAAFGAAAAAWWLPFLGAGANVFAGISGLATAGIANAPFFPVLAGRLASVVRDPGLARAIVGLSLLAGVTAIGLFHPIRSGGRLDAVRLARGAALVLAVTIVCGPLASPWYFVWLLPLVAVDLRPSWMLLVVMLPLYYLRFWMVAGEYAGYARLVPWLEFVPAVMVGLLEPLYLNRSSSAGRTRPAARSSVVL